MIKNYSSLSSNTTLEFNKKSEAKITSVIDFKPMTASWFFMILMLLGTTINHKATANTKTELFYASFSYTYHTVILKPLVAHGHSGGGGGYGYAFFSPTDHDKPNCPRDKITYTILKKSLHYNNTITSTNIKTIQS